LAEENRENEYTRGMVVVAHADDAEYGCSGTVARLCDEGWDMVYVICTDGSKGTSDREISGKELSQIRRKEQQNAGRVLGLKDIVFLEYEDSILEPTLGLRRDIAREIRRHRPDVLITTHPQRSLNGTGWGIGHPDHMAAGEAALSAVFPTARDHLTFPELFEAGLAPHKVAEVWIMGHSEPDLWMDVTGHMDTSIRALMQHASQMDGRTETEISERMHEGRRQRAVGKGMQYAEAFRRFSFGR